MACRVLFNEGLPEDQRLCQTGCAIDEEGAPVGLRSLLALALVFSLPHVVYGRYCVQLAGDTSFQRMDSARLNLGDAPLARVEKDGTLYKLRMGSARNPAALQPILEEMRERFPDAFIRKCGVPPPVPQPPPIIASSNQNETAAVVPHDRVLTLSLSDLGYKDDVTLSGVNPEHSFYIPIYKQLRGLDAEFHLRLPPVLDHRSSVSVYIDGTPVFTRTLQEIGYSPLINLPVRLSKRKDFSKITIKGTLFITEDLCRDLLTENLWMVLEKESLFNLRVTPVYAQIGDFFRDYDRRFHIVFSNNTQLSAVRLAYTLHKLYPGEKVIISFSDAPVKEMKNIVVGEFQAPLALKENTLYLAKDGVSRLNGQN